MALSGRVPVHNANPAARGRSRVRCAGPAGDGGLRVFDVGDPTAPLLVGQLDLPNGSEPQVSSFDFNSQPIVIATVGLSLGVLNDRSYTVIVLMAMATSMLAPPRPGTTTAMAWLSLDQGDNDPARFWAYVVAALQTVQPGLGERALAALQSPHPPPIAVLRKGNVSKSCSKNLM